MRQLLPAIFLALSLAVSAPCQAEAPELARALSSDDVAMAFRQPAKQQEVEVLKEESSGGTLSTMRFSIGDDAAGAVVVTLLVTEAEGGARTYYNGKRDEAVAAEKVEVMDNMDWNGFYGDAPPSAAIKTAGRQTMVQKGNRVVSATVYPGEGVVIEDDRLVSLALLVHERFEAETPIPESERSTLERAISPDDVTQAFGKPAISERSAGSGPDHVMGGDTFSYASFSLNKNGFEMDAALLLSLLHQVSEERASAFFDETVAGWEKLRPIESIGGLPAGVRAIYDQRVQVEPVAIVSYGVLVQVGDRVVNVDVLTYHGMTVTKDQLVAFAALVHDRVAKFAATP